MRSIDGEGYFLFSSADVIFTFCTAQAAEALTFADCDKSKQKHAFVRQGGPQWRSFFRIRLCTENNSSALIEPT